MPSNMSLEQYHQDAARDRFAKANRWVIGRVPFNMALLASGKANWGGASYHPKQDAHEALLGHAQHFRSRGNGSHAGLPVAIVAHNYEDKADDLIQAMKSRDDLRLHIAPARKLASWYYPTGTLLMCVTRPDVETIVWPTDEEMAETMAALAPLMPMDHAAMHRPAPDLLPDPWL